MADNFRSIAYTHEALMELLIKLDEGNLLDVSQEEFQANLLEMAQANVEALVGKDAEGEGEEAIPAEGLFLRMNDVEANLLAEIVRAEEAELIINEKIGQDEEGENAATGLCLRLWNLESFEDKAIDSINALDEAIGEAADAEAGIEASGLHKIIADGDQAINDALMIEIQAEVARAVAKEEEIVNKLNAEKIVLQDKIDEDINEEKERAEQAEADLNVLIENNKAAITNEAQRAQGAEELLQAALDEANEKIAELEAKNLELEAALAEKASMNNVNALNDRLVIVEAFEDRIADVEAFEDRIAEVEAFEARIAAVEAFEARIAAVEAFGARISAVEARIADLETNA